LNEDIFFFAFYVNQVSPKVHTKCLLVNSVLVVFNITQGEEKYVTVNDVEENA